MNNIGFTIRPARAADVSFISNLIESYAAAGQLLPRDPDDVAAHLSNFIVAADDEGALTGCCALRDFGKGLHEVRSLAVSPAASGRGIGSALVLACVAAVSDNTGARVFALTRKVSFFLNCGFHVVDKSMFPEKIWHDCDQCPKKERCDETAVIIQRGKPRFPRRDSILRETPAMACPPFKAVSHGRHEHVSSNIGFRLSDAG